MTNADKFKNIFGLYATELWSMPGKDFLKWLNSKVVNCSEIPNNSDTISRQQAINALTEYGNGRAVYISVEETVRRIEQLPFIQSEQKKGYWIYHLKWETDGECGYECSECGMGSEVDYNYCMNCGADMRGEQK